MSNQPTATDLLQNMTDVPITSMAMRAEANAELGKRLSDPAYLKNATPERVREIAELRSRATTFDPASLGSGVNPLGAGAALAEHVAQRAQMENSRMVDAVARSAGWSPEFKQQMVEAKPIPPAERKLAEDTIARLRGVDAKLLKDKDPLALRQWSVAHAMLTLPIAAEASK